jgi:gamma-glutamylcyclotransferase (GGCT)/AIG2-like uncharacterized protein YtfP
MTKLFVYGTLRHKNILQAVLGREKVPSYTEAILKDYFRKSLNIYAWPGSSVDGYIIDVSDDDLKKLDKYEAVDEELYKRITVRPVLEDGTEVECIAYQLCGTDED